MPLLNVMFYYGMNYGMGGRSMKSQRVQGVCKLRLVRERRCATGAGGEMMHQGVGVVGGGRGCLKGGAGLGVCIKA